MSRTTLEPEKKNEPVFTGVKMDKRLFKKAKARSRQLHQTYSDYVRQLIVRDVEPASK